MKLAIFAALLVAILSGCRAQWDYYTSKCKEMGYDWYRVGGKIDPPRVVKYPGKVNGRCVKKP